MTEQPLDTRRVVRALRRRPLVLIGSMLAGVLVALGMLVIHPPRYRARSLVLLPAQPTTANGQPTRDIQTEVAIASSADVLSIATRSLKPPPSVETLKRAVHAAAGTPDVLDITASSRSRAAAIAIANAAADAYRSYRAANATNASAGLVSQLQHQASELQTQISTLQEQILTANANLASLSPGGARATAQTEVVDNLRNQQANATTALNALQSQIAQAQLNVDVNSAGTQILERATTATNNGDATAVRHLGTGAVVGLLLAVGVIIFRDSRDRRLRRRDDIARAISVPALASLTTDEPRDSQEWVEFLKNFEPSADERWGMHRVLRLATAADRGAHVRLRVETLPEDSAAVAVAPALAAFAASAGVRTIVTTVGNDASNESLREACRIGSALREPIRPNLWTATQPSAAETERRRAQLTVEAAVGGDPRTQTSDDAPVMAVLAVSAGVATPERLRAAAADASTPFVGVVVANPDADDPSPGLLADASPADGTVSAMRFARANPGSAS